MGCHIADSLSTVVKGGTHVDTVPRYPGDSHASLGGHEVEVSTDREGRGGEDRRSFTNAGSTNRRRYVEGPHRQSRIVRFVLRDVGDRLVGVSSPRVKSSDQLIDSGAGQELGGGFSLRLGDLVAGATGRAVQHDHRVDEGARPVFQEPRFQGGHRCTQPGPGLVQVGGIDREIRAQGTGHAAHAGDRQVGRSLRAHAVGQLVGLINDDSIVLAKEFALAARVDTEEGVVRNDDVRVRSLQASCLREALVDERAVLAQALGFGDRGVVPGAIRDARNQVVAIPRRGLADPLADTQDLLAELARRADAHVPVLKQGALGGIAAVQLVQARVVRPAFEHRDLQARARL